MTKVSDVVTKVSDVEADLASYKADIGDRIKQLEKMIVSMRVEADNRHREADQRHQEADKQHQEIMNLLLQQAHGFRSQPPVNTAPKPPPPLPTSTTPLTGPLRFSPLTHHFSTSTDIPPITHPLRIPGWFLTSMGFQFPPSLNRFCLHPTLAVPSRPYLDHRHHKPLRVSTMNPFQWALTGCHLLGRGRRASGFGRLGAIIGCGSSKCPCLMEKTHTNGFFGLSGFSISKRW